MDRKYDVITLGEILLRLSTPINGRLAQGDRFLTICSPHSSKTR